MMTSSRSFIATLALFLLTATVQAGAIISDPNNPPHQSETGQTGYNDCSHDGDSQSSECQTSYINSLSDFCLFAPPTPQTIGDSERYEVSYCTSPGHGTRLIPSGTIEGAHFIQTKDYIQVTGVGDFTRVNVQRGDEGGELDPHGADGNGNPIGGLLLGNYGGKLIQFTEWTQFISDEQFCIRACFPGPNAATWCNHIYDVMGCDWNMPANYDSGSFSSCSSDDTVEPMGIYQDGSTLSTWYQGVNPTPAAHPVPKSSNCNEVGTVAANAVTPQPARRTKVPVPARHRRDQPARL